MRRYSSTMAFMAYYKNDRKCQQADLSGSNVDVFMNEIVVTTYAQACIRSGVSFESTG